MLPLVLESCDSPTVRKIQISEMDLDSMASLQIQLKRGGKYRALSACSHNSIERFQGNMQPPQPPIPTVSDIKVTVNGSNLAKLMSNLVPNPEG